MANIKELEAQLAKTGFKTKNIQSEALAEAIAITIVEKVYKGIILPILKLNTEVKNETHTFFDRTEFAEYLDNPTPDLEMAITIISRSLIGNDTPDKCLSIIKTKKSEEFRVRLTDVQVVSEYIRAIRQMLLVRNEKSPLHVYSKLTEPVLLSSANLFYNGWFIPTPMCFEEYNALSLTEQLQIAGAAWLNSLLTVLTTVNAQIPTAWLMMDTNSTSITGFSGIALRFMKPNSKKRNSNDEG